MIEVWLTASGNGAIPFHFFSNAITGTLNFFFSPTKNMLISFRLVPHATYDLCHYIFLRFLFESHLAHFTKPKLVHHQYIVDWLWNFEISFVKLWLEFCKGKPPFCVSVLLFSFVLFIFIDFLGAHSFNMLQFNVFIKRMEKILYYYHHNVTLCYIFYASTILFGFLFFFLPISIWKSIDYNIDWNLCYSCYFGSYLRHFLHFGWKYIQIKFKPQSLCLDELYFFSFREEPQSFLIFTIFF